MRIDADLVKRGLARTLSTVIGRRGMVRAGRFLSNWGRLDIPNDIQRNGESLIQKLVLEIAGRDAATIFDVGAHVGDWTLSLLDLTLAAGLDNTAVHSFEPCAGTRSIFQGRVDRHLLSRLVTLVPKGLSDTVGAQEMYVVGAGVGTNSLHRTDPPGGPPESRRLETIETTTADAYCASEGIAHVHLMKIDTEGHEMSVIRGSTGLLSAPAIDVVQFEYNHRWVHSRHFLKDAFEAALVHGYSLGKVTPRGVEYYRSWHFELETFREANYVLVAPRARAWFPEVRWWHDQ